MIRGRRDHNHGDIVTALERAVAKVAALYATFTIVGAPATKKNSGRIVGHGKRKRLLPSESYERWAASAIPQMRIAWAGRAAITKPVNVRALFYRKKRTGDLNNFFAALADAMEAAGVVENDRLIVGWDGSRLAHDKARPRVEVEITEVSGE